MLDYLTMFGLVGGGVLMGMAIYNYFAPPKPTLETKLLRQRNLELSVTAATLSVALEEACDRLAHEFGWDKEDTYERFYEEATKKL